MWSLRTLTKLNKPKRKLKRGAPRTWFVLTDDGEYGHTHEIRARKVVKLDQNTVKADSIVIKFGDDVVDVSTTPPKFE